jgi:hypothetical protein
MVQDVLTYITVGLAFLYAGYSTYKIFCDTKSKTTCSGGCSSCEEKSMLFEAIKKYKTNLVD